MARPFVRAIRRNGRTYFYLIEPQIVGGKTVGQKVLRKLTEDEAKEYGWKGESNGQDQTEELQEHETPSAEPVEQEPAQSSESTSPIMTPEAPLKEAAREPDQQEFKVVPRSNGFYALEPQRPGLPKGYSMVRTDPDGVTRVYCGLCPGFTCIHVEFMKRWLRERWAA